MVNPAEYESTLSGREEISSGTAKHGKRAGKGSLRQGEQHVQRPGVKGEHPITYTVDRKGGDLGDEAWTSAGAVTQGLDFAACRLGLGQRRGEKAEVVRGDKWAVG